MKRAALVGVVVFVAIGCGDAGEVSISVAPDTTMAVPVPTRPPAASRELVGLTAELVGQFAEPTFVAAPPRDDRLFVIEKRGRIRVRVDGEWHTYLDLTPFVSSDGPELGLVGLAFHPGFADNGRFFVYYTDEDRDSRLVEFSGSGDPTTADPAPPRVVLTVDQPQQWHNGGTILFGPDGYLWVSLGDGGGISDQYANGQNTETLLGSLLRIDVNAGPPYAIPPHNPFVTGGGAAEIWGYGLRNPFRFFIDPTSRTVLIADVGQERWEEINAVPLSAEAPNFGWPITEGSQCYVDILLDPEPASVPCSKEGTTAPVLTYPHGPACAIIGGPVYLGREIPELWGHYLYADWCAGWLRSIVVDDGVVVERHDWTSDLGDLGRINAVGTDGWGELYIATVEGGVFRINAQR